MRKYSRRINNRGQSMIEFVIVMPVLILFAMAIMQLALIATANIMTNYAAFSAARSYSVYKNKDIAKRAASVALIPISHQSSGGALDSAISKILEKIPIPEWANDLIATGRRYLYAQDNTSVSHSGNTTFVRYNFQLDMPMVGRIMGRIIGIQDGDRYYLPVTQSCNINVDAELK